jgi:putative tryptophan/tyrosine transport system substrate-binding protein
VCEPLVFGNRIDINKLALGARLPTMHGNREFLEGGGLLSYGPNILENYQRAAEYVDKILRGAKPADLPDNFSRRGELTCGIQPTQWRI